MHEWIDEWKFACGPGGVLSTILLCFHVDSVQLNYVMLGWIIIWPPGKQGLQDPLSIFYIQEVLAEAASFNITTIHIVIFIFIWPAW